MRRAGRIGCRARPTRSSASRWSTSSASSPRTRSRVGVEIQRGHGVDGFEASDDDVTVHAGEQRVRARWLVGCDGGRSTVRKQAGFEFVGTEPEFTGYSVQVELADPR